nr:immunoglobulin light chain junction region [Macaca mulatta]MOW05721.1 immunoglobulin light chain junction region [Macaca mulatta]
DYYCQVWDSNTNDALF